MMEKLNMEDLRLVNGGTNYDNLSEQDIAEFRKELADYKRMGMKKETMIDLYTRALTSAGASAEQVTMVTDMINIHWDTV